MSSMCEGSPLWWLRVTTIHWKQGLSWETHPLLFSSRNLALTSDQKAQRRGKKPRQTLAEGKRTPYTYMALVVETAQAQFFQIQ